MIEIVSLIFYEYIFLIKNDNKITYNIGLIGTYCYYDYFNSCLNHIPVNFRLSKYI